MRKNVIRLALCTMLFALCPSTEAQQPKVPRIGVLIGGSPTTSQSNTDAFRQGLKDLGYLEGKNIIVEYWYAEGKLNQLAKLAAELVRLKVDVMVTGGSNPARAAQKATTTIPIVMANSADPIRQGFVASLARPGGNMTGLSRMAWDLSGKRLELLKETIPRASRVAILWHQSAEAEPRSKEVEAAARTLGMTSQSLQVRAPNDLDDVFQTARREGAEVLIVISNGFTNSHRKPIVELAAKNRLPTMYEESQFVDAGGLMTYSPYLADLFRRAAIYVDRILKGAKPTELPVEQPTKFELVINLKAAKQIGLTIPPNVLARADRVIR